MIGTDLYSLAEAVSTKQSHIVVLNDDAAYLIEGDKIVCCIYDDNGDFFIHHGDNTDCGTYDEVMSEFYGDTVFIEDKQAS